MSDARAFLFSADTTQADFRSMLDGIDRLRAVTNWLKFLPASAVLISPLGVDELHAELKKTLPNRMYILVELELANKNGWLPRQVWDFINQPAAA